MCCPVDRGSKEDTTAKSAVKFNGSWYDSEEGALAKDRELKKKNKDKPDSIWYQTDLILERSGSLTLGNPHSICKFALCEVAVCKKCDAVASAGKAA
jgi:hypothetical protein